MGTANRTRTSKKSIIPTKKSSSSLKSQSKHVLNTNVKTLSNNGTRDKSSTMEVGVESRAVVPKTTTDITTTTTTRIPKKKTKKRKKPRHKHIIAQSQQNERDILLSVLQRKKLQHALSLSKHNNTPSSSLTNKSTIPLNDNDSSQVSPNFLDVQIHRIRNLNLLPRSILTVASSHPLHHSLLATSRENGSVEILDPNQKWNCVSCIPGMKQRTVDALAWLTMEKTMTTPSLLDSDVVSNYDNDVDGNPTFSCQFHKDHFENYKYCRLFGGSIQDGTIFEMDFTTQQHIHTIGSGGGAVFCLSSMPDPLPNNNNNHDTLCMGYLAAGCEDGSVRIIRVNPLPSKSDSMENTAGSSTNANDSKGLEVVATLPTAGAPVLSIAWKRPPRSNSHHQNDRSSLVGSILYAGIADGTIRRYDCLPSSSATSSKSVVQWKPSFRMTLEQRGFTTPTKVWALELLSSSNTVISGDSLGQVQFWDGNNGILLQSFDQNSQMAPVLDLAVDPTETRVFAAGVDSRVICMEKVPQNPPIPTPPIPSQDVVENDWNQANDDCCWALTHAHRPHTHDVRGLAICSVQDPTGGSFCIKGNDEHRLRPSTLLCSGGIDTKICTYSLRLFRENRPKRRFHMPYMSPISMAKEKRVLCVRREESLDLVQLKKPSSSSSSSSLTDSSSSDGLEGGNDNTSNVLGTINIVTPYNLVCSDISNDGYLVAVSDAANLMLFEVHYPSNPEELEDEEDLEEESRQNATFQQIPLDNVKINEACVAIKFSKVGKNVNRLICATASGPIHVLSITKGQGEISDSAATVKVEGKDNEEETLSTPPHSSVCVQLEHSFTEHLREVGFVPSRPAAISLLDVSPAGEYLAAGRNVLGSNSIYVFTIPTPTMPNLPFQHHFTLPALEAQHSALRFTCSSSESKSTSTCPALMVGCVNNSFYIFEMESKSMSDWTRDAGFPVSRALPRDLIHSPGHPVRLVFPPSTPSRFLLGGHGFFCAIDLNQTIPSQAPFYPSRHIRGRNMIRRKRRAYSNADEADDGKISNNKNFTICLKYNLMMFMDYVGEDEIVMVEQPWLDVVNSLPDAMERRVFGS